MSRMLLEQPSAWSQTHIFEKPAKMQGANAPTPQHKLSCHHNSTHSSAAAALQLANPSLCYSDGITRN
jgi:hypothetical protein